MKIDDFFAELKRRNLQSHHRLRRLPIGWAGQKALAFAATGNWTAFSDRFVRLSYGALKLLPAWNPRRADPRFDQIFASFAPKGIAQLEER